MDLIFDRTSQDVERWKALHNKGWAAMSDAERSEWLSPMKGAYGVSDMNRVETAVKALSERLKALGYLHPTLTVKTDWAASDVPGIPDFDRYYENVDILRRSVPLPGSTPGTPTTAVRLNHQLANDVERILADIDIATRAIQNSWHYAGDIYSGEV